MHAKNPGTMTEISQQQTIDDCVSHYALSKQRSAPHSPLRNREGFQPFSALQFVRGDIIHRAQTIHGVLYSKWWLLALLPKANSAPAEQSPPNATDPAVQDDVCSMINLFSWRQYSEVANNIRRNTNRQQCNTNLNLALQAIGVLQSASASASAGALTLLPTAGALIGSPTKELWVVYKLMPIAGILSMLLALGGNIVPTESHDYELNPSAFSYGGMIATSNDDDNYDIEDTRPALSGPQAFAAKVDARSRDMRNGTRYARVWYGMAIQLFWVGVLLTACWLTQSGSVLVWWCKVCRLEGSGFFSDYNTDSRHRLGVG